MLANKKLINRSLLVIGLLTSLVLFSDIALAQSSRECDDYARRRSRREEGGAIREGMRGAVGGALIGGIFGDAEAGARAGATIRGIGGGLSKRRRREEAYDRAYEECMRNSGPSIQPY